MSRDAMTDLLKLTFNLLVHYPKVSHLAFNHNYELSVALQLVPSELQYPALAGSPDDQKLMGDFWNSRLDG